MVLDDRIVVELKEAFLEHSENGKLNLEKLGDVFKSAGEPIPQFRLREISQSFGVKGNTLTLDEFLLMFEQLDLAKSWGAKLRQQVKTQSGVTQYAGSEQSAEGTVHSLSDAEKASFSNFINRLLRDDLELKKTLPIKPNSEELFTKLGDGILLCKLVNCAVPGTIDERAINKTKLNTFTINENLNLGINSSSAIGCHVVNVSAEDIVEGKPHLILGLLWQIIRKRLFAAIDLKNNPRLVCLLREGETLEQLLALSPEELLLRWVNYQLDKTSCPKRMANYSGDIKDSVIYSYLMEEILGDKITHRVNAVLSPSENLKRAELVIVNSENVECSGLVTAYDIAGGNQKLNLVFVAELFNSFPCLEEPAEPLIIEETREEKTYRNWMNSLGVKPIVNYIYSDLSDGLVLLQLFDIISPGIVNWNKVNKAPFTGASANIKKIENCNKAVELGKQLKLSLVGIAGDDIYNGNKTLVLGLVWQMMHLFTLGILQKLSGSNKPITENEIVAWANVKLGPSGHKISNFKDPSLHTAHPIIDLIEAIKEKSINREYVKSGSNDEEKLLNAQYAVSMARKIGAKIYALPEDIVEGKYKMVMTIFACLMARDLAGS